jgi:hypothetical protein
MTTKMKSLPFAIIFFLTFEIMADQNPVSGLEPKSKPTILINRPLSPALVDLYDQLFEAILKRDFQICPRLFGSFIYHEKVFGDVRAEGAMDRSFMLAQQDYLSDCRKIMDQLPKVGDTLKVTEYDHSEAKTRKLDNGVDVVSGVIVRCSYGTGLARLNFILPDAALVSGKWRFLDRFNQLVRYQYLDPATGE